MEYTLKLENYKKLNEFESVEDLKKEKEELDKKNIFVYSNTKVNFNVKKTKSTNNLLFTITLDFIRGYLDSLNVKLPLINNFNNIYFTQAKFNKLKLSLGLPIIDKGAIVAYSPYNTYYRLITGETKKGFIYYAVQVYLNKDNLLTIFLNNDETDLLKSLIQNKIIKNKFVVVQKSEVIEHEVEEMGSEDPSVPF